MNDTIPSHYSCLGIQPIHVITANFTHEEKRGFLVGCILKRMMRWQRKDKVMDLRKAMVELQELIRLETEAEPQADAFDVEFKVLPFGVGDFVSFIANSGAQYGMIETINVASQQVVVICNERKYVVPVEELLRQNGA